MMTSSNGNISALLALCAGKSPVGSHHKDIWCSLWSARTNGWAKNRDACDLRRHRTHYDITVMISMIIDGSVGLCAGIWWAEKWVPVMVTSSNGNIFRVTGPLWGEFTGHWWIPLTKANDAGLWSFLFICGWINGWVNNREAGDLRRHCAYYDVTVMWRPGPNPGLVTGRRFVSCRFKFRIRFPVPAHKSVTKHSQT